MNLPLTQNEIIGMSDAQLKDYIKQGFADVTEHDIIDKELYFREQRRIFCLLYTSPSPRD